MTFEMISASLADEFGPAIGKDTSSSPPAALIVDPARWPAVARFLRDDPRLGFNFLRCITAVDHVEDKRFTLVYELHAIAPPEDAAGTAPPGIASGPSASGFGSAVSRSPDSSPFWHLHAEVAIKVHVPRDNPRIASVADVWPAANWHEREAFDLFGILFDGHPDLTRILCCDDWVGYPLRKDYEFPLEYHGIPGTTEFNQTRPIH